MGSMFAWAIWVANSCLSPSTPADPAFLLPLPPTGGTCPPPHMPNEPPMPASAQDSAAQRPYNEGFTEGGDLTLRSGDGLDFNVHSFLLSLASSVLSGMITVHGTTRTLVEVPETSELVALMLKFIYPVQPPAIPSFKLLNRAFQMAEKYGLEAMKSRLRERMVAPHSPDSPVSISTDPLRAWAVAAYNGLPEETDAAMSFASKRYDFPQGCLSQLVRDMSFEPYDISIVKLTAVPFAKLHIMSDVLFNFHKEPMQLNSDNCKWTLCEPCASMFFGSKLYSAPEWQARWAHTVFMQLKDLPVHEWGPIFKIGFFNIVSRRNSELPIQFPGFQSICTCPDSINQSPTEFERWTASVHDHLKKRMIPVLLGDLKGFNLIEGGAIDKLADSLRQSTPFGP